MRSPVDVLKGSTEPRVSCVPLFHSSAGRDAIDLAASAGLVLDPWQEWVLERALGEGPGGLWTAPEVCLNVPRQCGKGSILEARELAGLALFGEELIIHTAHEFDTSKEHYLRMESLIRESYLSEYVVGFKGDPEAKFSGMKSGNSAVEIALDIPNPLTGKKKKHRLRFKARSKGGGRGFSGDLIVLDEAYALNSLMMDALLPTMGARKNPQLWYTSSAGLPDSDVLRELMERGHKGDDPELFYAEWSVDPDDYDPDSNEAIAMANPSMGYHKHWRNVLADRRRMSPEGFAREHLGVWEVLGGDAAIPSKWWQSCRSPWPDGSKLSRVALGVDVTPELTAASISVAGFLEDGSLVGEVFQQGEGTEWVAPVLREIRDQRPRVPILIESRGAAVSLEDDFRAHRVRVTTVPVGGYARACVAFFKLIKDGVFRHKGERDLDRAAGFVAKSMKGDALFTWKRQDTSQNIAPFVSMTLAVHGAVQQRERTKSSGKRRAVVL